MLREIPARQFAERALYEELPTPEDERFALLAEVIAASSGLKTSNGSFNRQTFLRMLKGDSVPSGSKPKPQPIKQQSPEQIEMYLNSWFAGSNAIFEQERNKRH